MSDLLTLTETAFRFLTQEHDFMSPMLKHEPRDDYDYVEYKRDELTIAVAFLSKQLPFVDIRQYPKGMDAPEGLPYSKGLIVNPEPDDTRYPFHTAIKKPLLGRLIQGRKQKQLAEEVERRVFELANHVRDTFNVLLEDLAQQEV